MGTLSDYIKWRGDLEFSQDGFNVIDNLVLSCLSYVQLEDVFKKHGDDVIDIHDVNDIYFENFHDEKRYKETSVLYHAPLTLKSIADTPRYKNIKIRNYVSKLDPHKTLQFAAMEFLLPDGTSYIAFRGTDDNLVGWKEDFYLALGEVEAERQAVKFLKKAASCSDRLLRVGGHSKGGHLAIYASALSEAGIQDRILNIYSNDGPGFMKKTGIFKDIDKIKPKIISVVPEESIVGLLMTPVVKPIVVRSTATSIAQHNPATWCLEGKSLDTVDDVNATAKYIDKKLKENVSKMSDEELITFVEDLFAVFDASGAFTLSGLKKSGIKGLQAMSKKAGDIGKKTIKSKESLKIRGKKNAQRI